MKSIVRGLALIIAVFAQNSVAWANAPYGGAYSKTALIPSSQPINLVMSHIKSALPGTGSNVNIWAMVITALFLTVVINSGFLLFSRKFSKKY